MAEEKQDLVTRIFVIVILGTIAFGLLFNLLTGGDTMDHMSGMGGTGNGSSLDVFLGGLIVLLVKLLLLVLAIAVLIGVVMWVKNTFFKTYQFNSKPFTQLINKDPILKTIAYVTLGLFGLVLVLAVFGGVSNTGMGYGNMSGSGMNGSMMGNAGFSSALSIAGILQLLIKLLAFILIISLIMALAAYTKKLYDQGAFKSQKSDPGPCATHAFDETQQGQSENKP